MSQFCTGRRLSFPKLKLDTFESYIAFAQTEELGQRVCLLPEA
jgi:hypothetical protein